MKDIQLHLDRDQRLQLVKKEGNTIKVRVVPSFPWSHPTGYLSLRDEQSNEVAFIEDPTQLDHVSRAALQQAVDESRFAFVISQIISIEDEFELRVWEVQTAQGKRRFQTKLEDWPRLLDHGSLLISDIAGDLYLITDPNTLDRKSQKLLWAFKEE